MLCDEMLEYQAIQTLLYMSPILLRYSFRPGGPSSILGTRSNDVSVRTNRTDRYGNQSVKWLIFSFAKNHPNSTKKGWCLK